MTASAPLRLALGGDEPTNVRALLVSCNFLSAHLDPPLLGRGLRAEDCAAPGREPVAVLNEWLWRSRFQASPSIVGGTVLLNRRAFTVVGIAPDQLTLEVPQAAIWIPYTMQPLLGGPADYFRRPSEHAWLDVYGRLAPGSTHRRVQAELATIATRLDALHPGRTTHVLVTNGSHVQNPLFARHAPTVIGLVMGGFNLILLIVCANVTILMLSRAAARRQEMAIRLSLGAGRGRLLRQLLTESLLVALVAGGLSWWLAYHVPGVLFHLSADAPPNVRLEPDWRVFAFTLAVAVFAGCVAGLSPAFESLRCDVSASLKPQGRDGGGRRDSRVRGLLIGAQLAASFALLTATGLLLRVQSDLFRLDPGYDPQSVLVTPLELSRLGYERHAARRFHGALVERVATLPGVRSVAVAHSAPFRGWSSRTLNAQGTDEAHRSRRVAFRRVSPAYFDAFGIRLLGGRPFTDAEARTQTGVVPIVVSETFARTFWPDQDPVGKYIRADRNGPADPPGDQRPGFQVVGLAADVSSQQPGQTDGPLFYEPIHHLDVIDTVLIVRATGDARPLVPAIRSQIRELDSQVAASPETVGASIDRVARRYAFLLTVGWLLAGLALVLCVLGLYGVAGFAAVQRTHEIGVRLALGARPGDVIRLLLGSIVRPLSAGLVAGIGLAVVLGVLFERGGLLLDVRPVDPVSYAAASVVVAAAVLLATFVPARRASRLDPWQSLRHE